MRGIFSQWSKPTTLNRSINIGYFELETYLWSWALAVELAKKHFTETALYCDTEAKGILVDKLSLPFDEVHVSFDKLDMCPAFWSYGKYLAFAEQTKPFAHIDSDLFLFNRLSNNLETAPFAFWASEDNLERNYPLYKYANEFVLGAPNPPKILLEEPTDLNCVVNAGLFLANDLKTLEEYLNIIFEFVHCGENRRYLDERMDGIMVICLDQFVLKKFLLKMNVPHKVFIEGEREQNLELFEKDGNYHFLGRLKHSRAVELIGMARQECGDRYSSRISNICRECVGTQY